MRFSEMQQLPLREAREIFYHGSDTLITEFSTEFLGTGSGSDQEGPGVYLTSSADDAKRYGKHIHVVEAKIVKSKLLPENRKTIERGIRFLIYKAPDKELKLSNWDENPNVAFQMAINSIMENYPNDYREALEQVWADFYSDNSAIYLSYLKRFGYQGFYLPRDDEVIHFICWDPSILTIKNVL